MEGNFWREESPLYRTTETDFIRWFLKQCDLWFIRLSVRDKG